MEVLLSSIVLSTIVPFHSGNSRISWFSPLHCVFFLEFLLLGYSMSWSDPNFLSFQFLFYFLGYSLNSSFQPFYWVFNFRERFHVLQVLLFNSILSLVYRWLLSSHLSGGLFSEASSPLAWFFQGLHLELFMHVGSFHQMSSYPWLSRRTTKLLGDCWPRVSP